jgi:hypothetical protein
MENNNICYQRPTFGLASRHIVQKAASGQAKNVLINRFLELSAKMGQLKMQAEDEEYYLRE